MKKYLTKYCVPTGLILYAVYNILNRVTTIGDAMAIILCSISSALILTGLFCRSSGFKKERWKRG